jgi:MFS family permease
MTESLFKGMVVAAFFPGITIYISLWYRKTEQTMRISAFFGAAVTAGAFGALMASIRLCAFKTTSSIGHHILVLWHHPNERHCWSERLAVDVFTRRSTDHSTWYYHLSLSRKYTRYCSM